MKGPQNAVVSLLAGGTARIAPGGMKAGMKNADAGLCPDRRALREFQLTEFAPVCQ